MNIVVIKSPVSSNDWIDLIKDLQKSDSADDLIALLTKYPSWQALPSNLEEMFVQECFLLIKNLLIIKPSINIFTSLFSQNGSESLEHRNQVLTSIIYLINQLIKIQSSIRMWLQKKKYQKILIKQGIKPVKTLSSKDILILISHLFKKHKLSLEEVFRITDKNYTGKVSYKDFLSFIQNLNLKIPSFFISRFLRIIDEDNTGILTSEDYYNTLIAYNIQTEDLKTIQEKLKEQVLVKYIKSLKSKNIDPLHVFSLCDIDYSGCISLIELDKYVKLLDLRLKDKEIYVLMELLDINGNGEISKQEYVLYMDNGARGLFEIEKVFGTETGVLVNTSCNIVSKLEIGNTTLFDILDQVEDFVTRNELEIIFRNTNPALTQNDINSIINCINRNNEMLEITKDKIEDFCIEFTESNMLTEKQYIKRFGFWLKKKNLRIQDVVYREGLKGFIDPIIIDGILKRYAEFNDNQIRRVKSLFGIKNPISLSVFLMIFDTEKPQEKFHYLLKSKGMNLEDFFDRANKKNSDRISATDFRILAMTIFENIDIMLIDNLLLMFPTSRIDKNVFIKVYELEPIPQKLIPKTPVRLRSSLYFLGSDKSADDFKKLIEKCDKTKSLYISLEKYNFLLDQIIDLKSFTQLFSSFGLEFSSAQNIFTILDKGSVGVIYGYMLALALDLVFKPVISIPTQYNSFASNDCIYIIKKLLSKLVSGIPIHKNFIDLKSIVSYENSLNLYLTQKESEKLAEIMPNPCYYYQLVGTLQSFSQIRYISHDETIRWYILRNKIKEQAYEYFSIDCQEKLSRLAFLYRFSQYFTKIEANSIYTYVYGNEDLKPLYHFYSIFDCELSSLYTKPAKTIYLPVKTKQSNSDLTEFLTKFAKMFSKSLDCYNMTMADENTIDGFAKVFEEKIGLPACESEKYFRSFKLTANHRIRLYHILYVLDSYGLSSMVIENITKYFKSLIVSQYPYGISVLYYLKFSLKGLIKTEDLMLAFEFMGEDTVEFVENLDVEKRGWVYGFELAYFIDKIDCEISYKQKSNDILTSLSEIYTQNIDEYTEDELKEILSFDDFFIKISRNANIRDIKALWDQILPKNQSKLPFYTFLGVIYQHIPPSPSIKSLKTI
ncbi:hypothetical protein SteCoe_6773 [Stentor coeruleus]|uniref:EF-hand domain-containing protein n=1 Tax=Stentor coeruleus TaxID=5963 RepID=A0A1R2CP85_9CILI|nr:hypothetical protein SteCoe_6773 [Stentor coeruleus]